MENSEESTKNASRKSTARLEERIKKLEHELAQANENVWNKEYLLKITADELKKSEEAYKKSLNEIEILSYTNRKAIQDLENLKLLLIGYEKSRKPTINVECQTDFGNQQLTTLNSSNYETVIKQQERMLNAIFGLNVSKGSKNGEYLQESYTQCNLLSSDESKLEIELKTLRVQIEKYREIPKFFIEETCEMAEEQVNQEIDTEISSNSKLIQGHCDIDNSGSFSRVLSPVLESEECDERVGLLEEECLLLRKSLDKVKKSFLFNKNMLSDAQLKISKFNTDTEQRRLENERLKSQLADFKRQFSALVMKINTAMRKVQRYSDAKLDNWMNLSSEPQNLKCIENIDEYLTKFLELVNQTKSEKDAAYSTLIEHQKHSEYDHNERSKENNIRKKTITFLNQQTCDEQKEKRIKMQDNADVNQNMATSKESTKDVIIDELNHLARLAAGEEETKLRREWFSDESLSTVARKICGKLKACYQVQSNEIKTLREKVEHLEHKRDELFKENGTLREECNESNRDREICISEINSLLSSFKIEEKLLLDYNFKGDIFENQLKTICSKLKNVPSGDFEEFERLRKSELEYAVTMESTAKEIIQLMVFLGCRGGVSCYNFTDKNMVHQVKTICSKIKVWHTKQIDAFKEQQRDLLKQIDEAKKCQLRTNILEIFVRETNNWLKRLNHKNISVDCDHMDTIDLQMRKAYAELQKAVRAHADDLENENFALIKLNKDLIEQIAELRNNSTSEAIEKDVMKEVLGLMAVFDCGEIVEVNYTIHNVKEICDQIKARHENRLKYEATLERSLEMVQLEKEKLLKEKNDLNKQIELLRSEKFNQDDANYLVALTKGKEVLVQGFEFKNESFKCVYREIQANFENGAQEKQIIKRQLEEVRSKLQELHEENSKLKRERVLIEETFFTEINDLMASLEEPKIFSNGDDLPELIRFISAKLRVYFKQQTEKHSLKVEEVNKYRARSSSVHEMWTKQISKLMIDNQLEKPEILEENNASQIEDVCNYIRDSFYKNINEGLKSRQILEAQIEGLRSTVGVLMEENECLREGKLLKDSCLDELNDLSKSVVKCEEYIGDTEKVRLVCKRIKSTLLQKSKLEENCKTCFKSLVEAINHEVSFPTFPFFFDDSNTPEEQLVEAFTLLKDIIVSEIKLKDTEIASVNEQLKTTTNKLEDLENAKRSSKNEENLQSIIIELRERILENNNELQKSISECQMLRENVKKIKENVYIASSLREKYIELMEKYYKQNTELEKQNEYMKEHIFVIKEYKRKLKDSEKTVADLRREFAKLNATPYKLSDQSEGYGVVEVEFKRTIEKMEEVMGEKETLQKEVDGLICENRCLKRNAEVNKEEIRLLTEEKQDALRKVKEKEERIKEVMQEKKLNAVQQQEFVELQKKKEAEIVRIVKDNEFYKQKVVAFETSNAILAQLQDLENFKELQKLQDADLVRIAEEKEFYKKKLETFEKLKLQELEKFKELQRKQEADIARAVEEKELYKEKLEIFKITNANLIQLQEELQEALAKNEELRKKQHLDLPKILAEKYQYQHKINIHKIESKRLNSDIEHCKEEIIALQQENENLNSRQNLSNDGEMKHTIDECANYKTKLNSLNGKLNKYLEDQLDYHREFESVRNNLLDENTKLKRKLSMCNDILTDFSFVLRSQNKQEQIISLRVFIKKRDTHIRILVEQKVEACKLLEMLTDGSDKSESESIVCVGPAVKAAQSVIETLIKNLSKQDERYNETNLEITKNDRILKDKLKDLENKKNMLKAGLLDLSDNDG